MDKYYAHSGKNSDKTDWQSLENHLQGVARLAKGFARVFDAEDWGLFAGLLHDAGKATQAFQKRLEGSPQRVDHSTFGARLAKENSGSLGLLLSYIIAGHHGGLPDGGSQDRELHYRLKHASVPDDVSLLPSIDRKYALKWPLKKPETETAGFSMAFFTRMIFSCLVDADFLDTEAFCSPENSTARCSEEKHPLADLQEKLTLHLNGLMQTATATPVNRLRQFILRQCQIRAESPPQFFSLTVPTGGGKTLSSLSFALDHAVANGLRRVIYAIPFTSIIEQNARVFQDIFGRESVLEHHCNYKEKDEPEEAGYNRKRGLAAENWDAPVVVTTNVQFFESLFSNKPSRCRKLHNIAGSVIVLDEAQAIPTEYLEPCLAALRELVERYNCSVVLCTATQPALDDSALRTRLPKIHEIIDNPQQLYADLRRTRVEFVGKLTDEELSSRLTVQNQVLCIVATKPQARKLFEMLPEAEDNFHLSTNMYPEHRRRVLDVIRTRLKQKLSCRVVSTSLVEAGVDLDFPVVYRAMAGLDSIAQAAGRCNREGKMDDLGQVYVYEPEQPPHMPWVKRCASRAEEALRSLPDADPIGLELMRCFFALLYDVQNLDKKNMLSSFPDLKQIQLSKDFYFPFRTVAEDFRFIEDESLGVIIPIEAEAGKLVQQLRYSEFPRSVLRKLQSYTVSVRSHELSVLNTAGALEMVEGQFPVLRNLRAYKEDTGLSVEEGEVWNPAEFIG